MQDTVQCRKLEICDSDGKSVASLEAAAGGAGLWINGPSGDKIAIYAINGQMAIGFYSHENKNPIAMDLALSLNDKGLPVIQFRDRANQVRHVLLEDLSYRAERLKRD